MCTQPHNEENQRERERLSLTLWRRGKLYSLGCILHSILSSFPSSPLSFSFFLLQDLLFLTFSSCVNCSSVGERIPKNGVVRFFHENTNQWLHSHQHTAPLSHEQEVSCYGNEDGGDTGDNWEVVTANDYWQRDAKIRYTSPSLSPSYSYSSFSSSFSLPHVLSG